MSIMSKRLRWKINESLVLFAGSIICQMHLGDVDVGRALPGTRRLRVEQGAADDARLPAPVSNCETLDRFHSFLAQKQLAQAVATNREVNYQH